MTWVKNQLNGNSSTVAKDLLTDDEFIAVQKAHYERMGAKSETIVSTFDAITAFKAVPQLANISDATAEDCSQFQDRAQTLPRNWRKRMAVEGVLPEARNGETVITRATVIKWMTALNAAYNRVNRNAGKRCIRGVVDPNKLLESNPWEQFTWIEDRKPEVVRHFSHDELVSVVDYFEANFPDLVSASLAIKCLLWSAARRDEISSLRWDNLRLIDGEVHFDIVGKWGKRKWFRVPKLIYEGLLEIKTASPFVFSSYPDELRTHWQKTQPKFVSKVRVNFSHKNFGEWLYERVSNWSKAEGNPAYLHVFRKTGLQFAVDGEGEDRRVADDAQVSHRVMTTHYTSEQDRHFRAKSNRTFYRIARSLPEDVLRTYGYIPEAGVTIQQQLDEAYRRKDWAEVRRLSDVLDNLG